MQRDFTENMYRADAAVINAVAVTEADIAMKRVNTNVIATRMADTSATVMKKDMNATVMKVENMSATAANK